MKYKDKQSIAWQRRELDKSFNDDQKSERAARRKFKRDVANFGIKVCSKYDRLWWNSLSENIKENIYRDWTSFCFKLSHQYPGSINPQDFLKFIQKARKENPATVKYRDNKLKQLGID